MLTSEQVIAKFGEDAPAMLYQAFCSAINQRDTMALLLERQGIIVTDEGQVGQTGSTDDDGVYHPFDYSSVEPEMREHLLMQASACHVGCPR